MISFYLVMFALPVLIIAVALILANKKIQHNG
jgi:hypothetical protein